MTLPGIFGVFYYRSANPKTLETLKQFLPVPAEGLMQEFAAGERRSRVCARTIRAPARRRRAATIYVSNLPVGRARQTLASDISKLILSCAPTNVLEHEIRHRLRRRGCALRVAMLFVRQRVRIAGIADRA